MKTSPFLFHEGRKVSFEIPKEWNLLTFADLGTPKGHEDPADLTRKALENPIGSAPLRKRISGSDTVAVLIEDLTRASPKRIVLTALLEELKRIGLPKENIRIIIALGTHRPLSSNEMETAFGRDLVSEYSFFNHDCRAADMVPVGRLDTGREVRINRLVHEAKFRIGIGSIFPHPMNGFGGGGKILFPGVADFESILEHHLRYAFHERAGLGKLSGNPFYENVCEIARSAGLHFVVNSILDHTDRLSEVVSGDPVEAHLEGIRKCTGMISKRFSGKSDLTIITSFPYSEGPQIMKPLAPASLVTKQGGTIILFADCSGNLPEAFIAALEGFHRLHGDDLLKGMNDKFARNELIMEGAAIDFNMAAGMALSAQHAFRIILVSRDIPRAQVERMGFVSAANMEEAFRLSRRDCPNPSVHIIPSGGILLPVL
ncbi:MAG: nickel-dependent lactate racemase [Desulfobacteraceae bacterium]|nr:MAG: nickel-dependent lactate racemase [Desulfobacteraceae bacterium]